MSALEAALRAKRQRSTTVVFVDVVGSTGLAARMGDEQWAWLLEEYQALVRRELAAWGGEEMDTAGDGLFAVFADPAAALGFGSSVRQAVRRLGLPVRLWHMRQRLWKRHHQRRMRQQKRQDVQGLRQGRVLQLERLLWQFVRPLRRRLSERFWHLQFWLRHRLN